MRYRISCPVCVGEAVTRGAPPDEMQQVLERGVVVPITTEPGAVGECGVGHKFSITMSDAGYALLYECALQRLADGSLRDALLDAYTALEMFIAIVPVRLRYDSDSSLLPADLPRLMKELKPWTTKAERALGAAFVAAAVLSKGAPPKFDEELTNLRNKAVHAGRYPTLKEAEKAVLEVERVVLDFERILDAASVGREPSFRLAMQMAYFPQLPNDLAAHAGATAATVLGGVLIPPPRAADRLAKYRKGELSALRLT